MEITIRELERILRDARTQGEKEIGDNYYEVSLKAYFGGPYESRISCTKGDDRNVQFYVIFYGEDWDAGSGMSFSLRDALKNAMQDAGLTASDMDPTWPMVEVSEEQLEKIGHHKVEESKKIAREAKKRLQYGESSQRGNRMKNIKEDLTVCCSCRGPHPEYSVKEWCSIDYVDTGNFCDYWDLDSDDMLCYECYHDKRDEFENEAEDRASFKGDFQGEEDPEDYDDYDEDHAVSFDDEDSPYFMGGGKGW